MGVAEELKSLLSQKEKEKEKDKKEEGMIKIQRCLIQFFQFNDYNTLLSNNTIRTDDSDVKIARAWPSSWRGSIIIYFITVMKFGSPYFNFIGVSVLQV